MKVYPLKSKSKIIMAKNTMVEYHDLTIRDGCHAISHKLTADMIKKHCIFAERSKIPVIEIGHGNGLGASSITCTLFLRCSL